MAENLIFSLNSTVPLFCVMALGYLLRRKNFFSEAFLANANKLVFHITLPVLLFLDMAQTDVRAVFDGSYVLFCAGVTALSIAVIWLLAKRLIRDKSVVGEFVQASYRSSAAILGTAFIQLIYGTAGMSGLMILGSVPLYNIFAVLILVLESPGERQKGSLGAKLKDSLIRIASNPIILGILAGFVFGFFRIPLPKMVSSALDYVGKITTPLALLVIGAGFRGKAALGRLRLTAVATVIKLLILPAVFLPLAVLCGFTDQKLVALLVMLGSITTPASFVMAKQMGHEGTLTASVCVATTMFSAVTLTFWLFLCSSLGWI
ncbi:MAG: AEC family transporter [Firmicutes bacterium]|nr:AEC family transporter [Bacillota bacterium]